MSSYQAAQTVLSEYVEFVELAQNEPWLSKERRAFMKSLNGDLKMVNYYLRDLVPDIEPIGGGFLNDHVRALPRVRRALELLTHWQEMSGRGKPDDVVPPMLHIGRMDLIASSVAIPSGRPSITGRPSAMRPPG